MAQYKQIENDILDKISTCFYKKNDMIPTELELARNYNVSRVTVRRATDNLVAKGLLYRTPGVGTFVTGNTATQKIAVLRSFTEEMKELGLTPSTKVNSSTVKEATPAIANILGIAENDMVYYIERYRYGNGELLVIEHSYMSVKKHSDISIKILEGSKYEYFEKVKGISIDYSYHQTSPMLPTDNLCKLFSIDNCTPIIRIGNTTYSKTGDVLDYTELFLNSPKYQLNYIRKR